MKTRATEVFVDNTWLKITDTSKTKFGEIIWFEVQDGSGTETLWTYLKEATTR